ncbi:MAG: DUF3857 domain-containing protein [Chitinophagaceae bacterium]
MIRILLLISLFACGTAWASEAPYAVGNIAPQLLKGANVVKRMEEIRFEVFSTDHTFLHKYAFTILNENGDRHASLEEWYDKLRKIESIEGALYDANGKLLKKLKTKDVSDLSGVSEISIMDDNRRKTHNFFHKTYPYTIEYEVQVRYNNSFHFPPWVTQEDEFISVEQSKYTFVCAADYQFRYKTSNYKGLPVQVSDKGKKSHTWQVNLLPAIERETASPRWQELTTMLSVAPNNFEIEGHKGNMESWKEFGKFLYALKKGKDELPVEVKRKVQELISGEKDDKEKIRILYQFLQQNTRYISIQLGLGGWQPFDAVYVATKGYGDCKALSNYMFSLLKEAKIKSQYAVIKAGNRDHYMMEDFPSNQFNHAILCVPLPSDTVWLECTSQTTPAGYMGDFTGNRKALLIDENGGTLVSTPRYGLAENLQQRTINGKLDVEGSLSLLVDTRYHSVQQDNLHQLINGLSKEKVKEVLQENLHLATYNINDFSYKEQKGSKPHINETLDIFVTNYATVSGRRLFLVPNLLNRSTTKLNLDTTRKYDLCFEYAYRDVDSVLIEVPDGYELEAIAPPMSLKTKFGTYSCSTKLEGNKVTYIRIQEQFAGRYPAKDYADLARYYSDIFKSDRSRLVLVKKG